MMQNEENAIYSQYGTRSVLGYWDGERIDALLAELRRIVDDGNGKRVDMTDLPHAEHIPAAFDSYTEEHPVWACDAAGRCLTGDAGTEIETIAEIAAALGL